MALIKWEDLPSTKTPISAKNLNDNFNEVLNLIYPIGRVIIDETDTDYSNYLGFKWQKTLVGVVPVGKDTKQTEFDTLGKTGGEKTHKLTIEELPSHGHSTKNICSFANGVPNANSGYGYNEIELNKSSYGNETGKTGGDKAHNNLQPYKVVNYWKRIS